MAIRFLPRIDPDDVSGFTTWVDEFATAIENAIQGDSGSFSVLNLIGNGRIVAANITEGKIEIPNTGGMVVVLPAHEKGYIIKGTFKPVLEPIYLYGASASNATFDDDEMPLTGGQRLYLDIDQYGIISPEWRDVDDTEAPQGMPYAGTVYTNANRVLYIDAALADYIQPQEYARQTIADLQNQVNILVGALTGSKPGKLTASNIQWADDDSMSIADRHTKDLLAQQNAIDDLSVGRFSFPMILPSDLQTNTIARLSLGMGEKNPHGLDRLPVAAVMLRLHGDGTQNSKNFVGPGTVSRSEDGRTFMP